MGIVRQIKNVTGGYTSAQKKVRDVTKNDDNPPSRMTMQDIADLTYSNHEVLLIMDMIDKRLNDKGKYWRHVNKALVLLDYLVHVGSDKVIRWCHENFYIIKTLREFHHRDDTGRDVGRPIRERATKLTMLLGDRNRLESERARFSRGGRRRRRRPSLPDRPSFDGDDGDDGMDDDLARALALSKETAAEEEERRRMAGGQAANPNDLQNAMLLSQQNQDAMMMQQQYLYQQQQAEEAALAQAQQEYAMNQQAAQLEAQRLYELQMQQQQAALQQQQLQQQQLQQQLWQQQLEQQQLQAQQAQQAQQPLEPLKTGSNNPFAAFNQQQAQKRLSQKPLETTPTGSRPSLHRQSTFDKDHMDRLDAILSLDAPMDTFGNTGSAKIPAQHTENTGFVDSSGRGLTAMLTARQTGNSSNPFSTGVQTQQYTGIASTQMQPAHTGYGFGNANHSSTNLIDL